VRLAAVTVACECAEQVPDAMQHALLQEVEKRLRDKKVGKPDRDESGCCLVSFSFFLLLFL
jgi:hypothetical protein